MIDLDKILEDPTGNLDELEEVLKHVTIETSERDALSPKLVIDNLIAQREDKKSLKRVHDFFKIWRQERYRIKIKRFPESIKIVSEGDSWFQYPVLLNDIIDRIFEPKKPFTGDNPYAVYSLGHAGAKLEEILRENEFSRALKDIQPDWFLISGGGNDLIDGGDAFEELIKEFPEEDKTRPVEEYIFEEKLLEKLDFVMRLYQKLFDLVLSEPVFKGKILCHGYDYPRPVADGIILGKRFVSRNIKSETTMFLIIKYIIDLFNDKLTQLIQSQPLEENKSRIIYVNCRGSAGPRDWNWNNRLLPRLRDDFHPNNTGFDKIAKNFINVIENS